MHPTLGTALFYLSPALLRLATLARLPSSAARFLGALSLVLQVTVVAMASWRASRALATRGELRALAALTLSLSLPSIAVTWLGAMGLGTPLLVPSVLGAACLAIDIGSRRLSPLPDPARRPGPPWSRFEVAVSALSVLSIARMTVDTLRESTRDADSVWYHLPMAAEIVRTGSIRPNPILTLNAVAYPGAREAVLAWLALPLRSENLALLFPIEALGSALSIFSLARSFDVPRPAALSVCALYVLNSTVATAAVEQKNDLFLGLAFLLAFRFLRALHREGRGRYALLAGLAAGLLAGTKFTGVPVLAVLLVISIAAARLARDRARLGARAIAIGIGAATIAGAVFYARNLALFHNPFYPKHLTLFGQTLLPGLARLDRQHAMTVLGLHPARIAPFFGQFVAGLGPAVALAPILVIAAPLAARRGHPRLRDGAWLWFALMPAALFALYALLPYSVHPRGTSYWYVQPRLILPFFAAVCLGLGALVSGDHRRDREVSLALVVLSIAAAALWMPWRSLLFVLAISIGLAWIPHDPALTALRRLRLRPLSALAALLAAAVAALSVEGYREGVKADPAHGYRADPVEGWGEVSLWVREHVRGARILYAETILNYPLFGPGLTNTLFWLRPDPSVDGVEALGRAAREVAADYVVVFSPVKLRYGARGERFEYGPSPALALAERRPEEVEVAFTKGHAVVLRVKRPAAVSR